MNEQSHTSYFISKTTLRKLQRVGVVVYILQISSQNVHTIFIRLVVWEKMPLEKTNIITFLLFPEPIVGWCFHF